MAKKRVKKFDVVKAVKAAAREAVGTPPATRMVDVVSKKRRKVAKHKPTLAALLTDES